MPGAASQLASHGAQDVYITGQPQITFFKLVYRRHTNFAVESVPLTFDGTADFGRAPTVSVPRNGDLLGSMWLEITVPDLAGYDISPTPAEGNTIDVTSAPGVYVDADGSYRLVDGPDGGLVAVRDARGNYFRTGTPGVPSTYADPIPTWPYMTVSGVDDSRVFGNPTTDLRYVNGIGLAIVRSVELELGGSRLDKHYSEWWDVWSELTEPAEKKVAMDRMVGKYDPTEYAATWQREQSARRTMYVPIRFCFNRVPGLYLPLVALSFHQIKLNFEFRPYLECVRAAVPVAALTAKAGGTPLALEAVKLYANNVFLDVRERVRMSQMDHEYLITQLQFQGDEPIASPTDPNGTVNRKFNLNFNHPVRELVWVYQAAGSYEVDAVAGNDIFNYDIPAPAARASTEVFESVQLMFNGADRFGARPGSYFRLVQPYEHHTRVPGKSVHVYSFALGNAEDPQPNGTANFTRTDSAQMQFVVNPALPAGRIKFYAVGFNVLRIKQGMGAIAFTS